MKNIIFIIIIIGLVVVFLKLQNKETTTNENVQIANPASEYCIEMGGSLEIRTTELGQSGHCHLPDSQVIEEWEFFRSSQENE